VTRDLELIEAAQDGSVDAFTELVHAYREGLFRFLLTRCSSHADAEDALQDTFINAYRYIRSYDPQWRFSTWLYRIVANCSATHMTKRQRHRHDELSSDAAVIDTRPDHDPVLQGEVSDLRDEVDRAIRDLPPRLRAVVVLRDVYDLSHEAIAAELDISVTAAKVRLHRARRRLREELFPLPGEEQVHAI